MLPDTIATMPRHYRIRGRFGVQVLFALAWIATAPLTGLAADDRSVPVEVHAQIDDSRISSTGIFRVKFTFTPNEDLSRPFLVRVVVGMGGREILVRDHTPAIPTTRWKKGKSVAYEIRSSFPSNHGLRRDSRPELRIGFIDPVSREIFSPAGSVPYRSGLVSVADMAAPFFDPITEDSQAKEVLATARQYLGSKQKNDAWDVLEFGIRMADSDRLKYLFREDLEKLSDLSPRALSPEEESIIGQRINSEKIRYFRLVAGRMYDRNQYHGALALLETVGGTLNEQADEAVIGALSEAKRVTRDLEDVREKLLAYLSAEEQNEIQSLLDRYGLSTELLSRARQLEKKQRYSLARALYRKLRYSEDPSVTAASYELLPQVEEQLLAATPPEQTQKVEQAIHHPVWDRTIAVPSHRFIFIGPRDLVNGIPRKSRMRFDLAYIFLTDLFGRVPNPAGDRVTVYFKELWDFGGGVGGGKTIAVGRAKPDTKGLRVDTGLLYHELTHCIDDTKPIFAGFREGLANVGAACAFEMLEQEADGLHSFTSNLKAFRSDYLERDLEYWRIQNYGPSAGFFLHFLDRYARQNKIHNWAPLRQFFREYRAAPIRDGREPYIARALAHYLMRAFGDDAFDDLVSFRFPLKETDRMLLGTEVDAFDQGHLWDFENNFESFPNSPLPRDLVGRQLLDLQREEAFDDVVSFGKRRLGMLYDWKIIGPFSRAGADSGTAVFPPEYEIDFEKRYTVRNNICNWRDPTDHDPVILEPTGWVQIRYNYQDNTATYGLTHVTVEEAQPALAHIRADDDLTLFINDERIGSYRGRGENHSSYLGWRGPHVMVPDAIRLPIQLKPGRNKILIRIRNRYGNAGFCLALSKPNGDVIPNLTADNNLPEVPAGNPEPQWKRAFRQSFKNSLGSGFNTTVGGFRSQRNALVGSSTDRGVAWRKYTVRPGFPKDSPSNLMWLKEKHTRDVTDFKLAISLDGRAGRPPKLLITFQGEGGKDGLSGWTLILSPSRGKLGARLEKYDRLVYHCEPLEIPEGEEQEVVLTYFNSTLSVSVNDTVLFDRIAVASIPGRHRIGLATWGATPRISALELTRPQ